MALKLILSLISIILLSVGWMGGSGIGLLAGFVPVLMISAMYGDSRQDFWKTFGWIALIFGLWSALTTWWIWYATPIGPILSVLITIVLFGGMFMIYHYVSKRASKALSYTLLVAGWIACEYLYTIGEVSFPWLTLGNGFANDIKLIQWYDTTGVFGGSLWVWVVNILLYEAVSSHRHGIRRWFPTLFAGLIPIAISLIRYYTYEEPNEKITVTVVQPDIEPYMEKYILPQSQQTDILLSLASEAPEDVDFIVMPETAIHEDIWENNIEYDSKILELREFIRERYPHAQLITGASTAYQFRQGEIPTTTAREFKNSGIKYDVYNTAVAVDSSVVTQKRHKSILVVGVEKMPFYNLTRHLEWLILDLGGITGQLGTDPQPQVFVNSNGISSGVPICWEGVFGYYCGQFAQLGAEVFFVISNDGWWEDTRGHKELFLFSRLRAVESRRSIARSANTGTSGFINQRGDILQRAGWEIRTAITDNIALNDHITFYSKYGDYIARISCYVLGLSLLYYIGYRYKRRNKLVD